MKISSLVLPSIALGAAAILIFPGSDSKAFTTTGAILNLGQRDFRVRNNFSDPQTNNNTTPHAMFPGAVGVFMSAWKGAAEWGSELHGDGSGDPSQGMLGSGGANFDSLWSGRSTGVGNVGDNVVSATTGCSSGVLAFAESTGNSGWRIRFCDDQWIFADGPGGPGSQIDFQSIMCHEYGHALGLGHSASGSATMFPSYNGGTGSRSINFDDIAGIQSLYGVKSATKPMICKTSASGGILTITGSGFDPLDNRVWFGQSAVTSPNVGPVVTITGVPSTNGGTQISLAIPGLAGPGDVAVRLPGSANTYRLMSNCFPTDLVGTIDAGCPFQASSISPAVVAALDPGTAQSVTVTGSGLDTVTSITLEPGIVLDPSDWTIVDAGTITVNMPIAPNFSTNTLTLDGTLGSDSVNFLVGPTAGPVIEMGTGDPLNTIANGDTFEFVVAGTPGDNQVVYYSPSNVPSSIPVASFLIGNNFTEFFRGPLVTIGANGVSESSMPLVYTGSPMAFYVQSLDLSRNGAPAFEISNLQSITLTP